MLIGLALDYNGQKISFSARELFGIARQEVLKKLEDLLHDGQEVPGGGTQADPFELSTLDQYLLAAFRLHEQPNVGLRFFDIGQRLIACDTSNAYMTDWGEVELNDNDAQDIREALIDYSPDVASEADQNTLLLHSTQTFVAKAASHFSANMQLWFVQMVLFIIHLQIQTTPGIANNFLTSAVGLLREARLQAYGEIGPSYPHFQETFAANNLPNHVEPMRRSLEGAAGGHIFAVMPVLGAVMFVAETSRHPVAFLSGLIMLDFIQHQVRYGQGVGKQYSWTNMLFSQRHKPQYRNGYGAARTALEWGGKFSMAHQGSFTEQPPNVFDQEEAYGIRLPDSHQKDGSLLIRWLALKMKHRDRNKNGADKLRPIVQSSGTLVEGYDVFTGQDSITEFEQRFVGYSSRKARKAYSHIKKSSPQAQSPEDRAFKKDFEITMAKNDVIENVVRPMIRERLRDFDFQLQNHPTQATYGVAT